MINVLDFIWKTDLYKKFQVDELLFVEFKCPADDYTSGIWWHNNFFAFVLAGETLLKTPQHEHTLKPGDCFFAKKGSVLSLSETQEDFCELLIFVPDDFIKSVIHKYKITLPKDPTPNKPDTIIPLVADDVLLIYFQSLLSYFSMPSPPPIALLKLKFEELIVHIVSSHHYSSLKYYFDELCARAKPSIKEIMEANFFSNLSLNEFSRLCARSLSGFKREFMELFHTTPGKWLLEKRLEYSKYLLETTNLTIDEVCVESGFENRSHFIRVFKNKFSLTPGKFILQNKLQH
ncbi:AraC family transcriptional regulator [Chitinophagaceae bacterium LB-8]|uniref:AraC family transcriptional regulator n=1 Tax=Paraflavisolibacter caeni TaxID=2982496 RepID=A0A9X3BHN4_9BACT|nr:AraC family transcriptional regulator [Paraflavisolibacter caeni]MCU7549967.1 AraC family transcriptional regulator [Paraflavisolibacter caeni]